MALFRRTFGVRSGKLKLQGRDHKIYHIHSTDLDNIDHIISALYEHREETGSHLTIFHRNIIIEKFPRINDNKGNIDLKRWLEDTELQLKNQVQITLHKHITKNNTSLAINNISKIENLISYTFKLAEKEKFYINLILPRNPSTINLTNNDFKHIFNNDTNTSPEKTSPITSFTFMTQKELNNQKRKALQQTYNKTTSEQEDDDLTEESTTSTTYYVVRRGFRTGIFTTWPEAEKSVLRYRNAGHKKFRTKEFVQTWLNTAQRIPTTPYIPPTSNNIATNKRSKTSYKETATTFSTAQQRFTKGIQQQHFPNPNKNFSQTSNNTLDGILTPDVTPQTDYITSICPTQFKHTLNQLLESGTSLDTIHNIVQGWVNKAKNN